MRVSKHWQRKNGLKQDSVPSRSAEGCRHGQENMDRVQHHTRFWDSAVDTMTTPGNTTLGMEPDAGAGDGWLAFMEQAASCESTAYEDLYRRLKCFRRFFGRHLFGDPEGAYCDFVRDLVDRYGLVQSPQSLVEQARIMVMRRTADRIGRLTNAAQILSTIPKREREVFIRSQLALQPTGELAPAKAAAGDVPRRKAPGSSNLRAASRRNGRGGIHHVRQGSWMEEERVTKTA